MSLLVHRAYKPAILVVIASGIATSVLSQGTQATKMSSLAPVADLLQQIDFFVARVSDSLADPKDFDLAKQSRTVKDGNTLAALAIVLAEHDEPHALRAAMPGMLRAAQRLATAEDNVERAQQALAQIKAARSGATVAGDTVKPEKAVSLSVLMKQVPLIHNGLKRGVEGNRLQRQAAQSAGQAATLAAIAQVSLSDTEYIKQPKDAGHWQAYCAQMRDAAGEVNSAVHAGDPDRVAAGMRRLARSCEACHEKFRSH